MRFSLIEPNDVLFNDLAEGRVFYVETDKALTACPFSCKQRNALYHSLPFSACLHINGCTQSINNVYIYIYNIPSRFDRLLDAEFAASPNSCVLIG